MRKVRSSPILGGGMAAAIATIGKGYDLFLHNTSQGRALKEPGFFFPIMEALRCESQLSEAGVAMLPRESVYYMDAMFPLSVLLSRK
jgi:hypothetical protein